MSDQKPEKSSSTITYYHLRTIFFFLMFTLLFLFYPGNSYYLDFFSKHREICAAVEKQQNRSSTFNEFPAVINKFVQPTVSGRGVYIIDLETATPVYWRNENLKLLPASTTKVITALTAYDAFGLDDTLEVKRIITEGQ